MGTESVKSKYCVLTAEPVSELVQRLLVHQAFGVYPADVIDYQVKPELVKKNMAYVIDIEELSKLPDDPFLSFEEGLMDGHFLVTRIPKYMRS